jgi:hypothetical protein
MPNLTASAGGEIALDWGRTVMVRVEMILQGVRLHAGLPTSAQLAFGQARQLRTASPDFEVQILRAGATSAPAQAVYLRV